jgi:hypothetical protein
VQATVAALESGADLIYQGTLHQKCAALQRAQRVAWSRPELRGVVDVLVMDEAAQISLANVVALSPAAPSLILFGDPAQLGQPQRGVHPPGADASALEYLLGAAPTLPPELGVFLAEIAPTKRWSASLESWVSCSAAISRFRSGYGRQVPGQGGTGRDLFAHQLHRRQTPRAASNSCTA